MTKVNVSNHRLYVSVRLLYFKVIPSKETIQRVKICLLGDKIVQPLLPYLLERITKRKKALKTKYPHNAYYKVFTIGIVTPL